MDAAEVDAIGRAAAAAAPALEALGRHDRAAMLDGLADALETARTAIVATADRETSLGDGRLSQELIRTCFQLRLFGEVLREGSYLEATIDMPAPTPMGPRPDLRRMLVPLGPVAVFGASNFPLAFSVPGGDTASALAAGCPVVKAHPAHPDTSRVCWTITREAIVAYGVPAGALGLVEGLRAGAALVGHPAIAAVGFTGSAAGGHALQRLTADRPQPIPFYGELGSVNPLVVTPGAASQRAEEIAQGFVASMTLGTGQFCTKPGLLFLPSGAGGARLRAAVADAVRQAPTGVMLTTSIHDAFDGEVARRRADGRLTMLGEAAPGDRGPRDGAAIVFEVAASNLDDDLLAESFGPTALVVGYTDTAELVTVLDRVGGQLTATVHAAAEETELIARLHEVLRGRAGRLIFDGYPTGVAVAWAMHHGGPHPATTNIGHTSVGVASTRRWLRPISYQNAPAGVLPPELRDDNPTGVPRRVNGILQPIRTG